MKESIFNLKYNVPKIKCKIFFKDHLDTPNKEYYVDEHKIRLYEKKFNMKIEDFIPKICMLRDINGGNVIICSKNDGIPTKMYKSISNTNVIENDNIANFFEMLRKFIHVEDDFNNDNTLTKRAIEEIEYNDIKLSVVILDHYENKTYLAGKVF